MCISPGVRRQDGGDVGGCAVPEAIDAEPSGGSTPATWRVLLLNDDDTPMEFVVHVLQELFDMDHEDAVRLMLRVHHEGSGECGAYSEEVAKMKVEAVIALAREHEHPLQCVMEKK
jgi:ATP-dependent Clp protease adaptor protein ClpS